MWEELFRIRLLITNFPILLLHGTWLYARYEISSRRFSFLIKGCEWILRWVLSIVNAFVQEHFATSKLKMVRVIWLILVYSIIERVMMSQLTARQMQSLSLTKVWNVVLSLDAQVSDWERCYGFFGSFIKSLLLTKGKEKRRFQFFLGLLDLIVLVVDCFYVNRRCDFTGSSHTAFHWLQLALRLLIELA